MVSAIFGLVPFFFVSWSKGLTRTWQKECSDAGSRKEKKKEKDHDSHFFFDAAHGNFRCRKCAVGRLVGDHGRKAERTYHTRARPRV